MYKHILALIVLSVLAVLFRAEFSVVLQWLVDWHQHVLNELATVFSSDKTGKIVGSSLALMAIPLAIAAVAACGLWILRRKMVPFLPEVMWVIWLLLVALITGTAGAA